MPKALDVEEKDPNEDSIGDNDEMIYMTLKRLWKELEEMFWKYERHKKRKRPTRWDNH